MDVSLVQIAIDVATDLQLRAGDAIYVALAHQLNIPLVSWDKEQLQKASTLVTTYTPENYIFPTTGNTSNEKIPWFLLICMVIFSQKTKEARDNGFMA